MSRIGRKPVPIPQGVDVKIDTQKVFVKGPLGALTRPVPPDITVAVANSNVVVQRAADTRQHRALHGLVRNEIRNMIEGVTKGFERVLEINGVGYKAALSGRDRKSTRLNSSHVKISYAVFCLKKKKK